MNDMQDFCEEAQQKVHDADAVMRGGLTDSAKIATFARLMFEAGYAEASHIARSALHELEEERPPCQGCANKIDHYCWDRGGQFWAGDSNTLTRESV